MNLTALIRQPSDAPSMSLFSGQEILCFRGERTVFSGLDFDLEAGGALVLRGPNGSGKSSLLRVMAGLIRPRLGSVRWQEEDIHEDPEGHSGRLHYVGHQDAVKPVLTVAENVHFWAGFREAEPDVMGALAAFRIGFLSDVPGRFLSAGQKRRVNLARIVAAKAPLWLLDEPTTALDAEATDSLRNVVSRHREGGGMVVASTHAELGLEDAETLNLADFQAPEPLS